MEGLRTVVDLIGISARTAPKTAGKDFVLIKIIEGEEIKRLAEEMYKYGEQSGKKNFDRDGKNVLNSPYVILIGIKDAESPNLNCGACGFETCVERDNVLPTDGEFRGPQCAYRILDLGIALGSAVKTASILNVDNRIMYRIGVVARKMGLVDWDVVMGIPLSATGKSIYFDR